MTTKLFALTIAVFLLLSQPSLSLGQSASQQQDWTAIEALASGVKLLMETKNGKQLKGNFNNASNTTIVITRKNRTETINRDDIQKIYQLSSGGSRGKSTLIGAGVGAGVGAGGAAIALGATGGSDDFSGIMARGILIGAGIGAVIGLLAGNGSKRTLIYESR
jgi:hypothetical protein